MVLTMRFEYYHEPTNINECLELIVRYGTDGRILAGGTDLVVRLRSGQVRPKAVISLNGLSELSNIKRNEDGSVDIGAMAILRDVMNSHLLAGEFDVIRQGAGHVSSMQVRNVATLGGNSCNAAPSADTVPGLIVAEAFARIVGPEGGRSLPLEDFFLAPGKTALGEAEILTGFHVPASPKNTGCSYKKYSIRGDTDLAIVGTAARLTLDGRGCVQSVRIALGAVAPTPMRALDAERILMGKHPDGDLLEQSAAVASEESKPISDQRATAEYRREMVRVWTRHALTEAFQKACNPRHEQKSGKRRLT